MATGTVLEKKVITIMINKQTNKRINQKHTQLFLFEGFDHSSNILDNFCALITVVLFKK